MGMLERLSDARGTLEGKIVAVILAILLVLPVASVTAFASGHDDEEATTETEQTQTVEPEAVEEVADQGSTPVATPESFQPVVTSEPSQPVDAEEQNAVLALNIDQGAMVVHNGKTYTAYNDEMSVTSGENVKFAAKVESGFALAEDAPVVLVAFDGSETELNADASGIYTITSAQVSQNLVLQVHATKAEVAEGENVAAESAIEEQPEAVDVKEVEETEEAALLNAEQTGEAAEHAAVKVPSITFEAWCTSKRLLGDVTLTTDVVNTMYPGLLEGDGLSPAAFAKATTVAEDGGNYAYSHAQVFTTKKHSFGGTSDNHPPTTNQTTDSYCNMYDTADAVSALRFNTENGKWEAVKGGSWSSIDGSTMQLVSYYRAKQSIAGDENEAIYSKDWAHSLEQWKSGSCGPKSVCTIYQYYDTKGNRIDSKKLLAFFYSNGADKSNVTASPALGFEVDKIKLMPLSNSKKTCVNHYTSTDCPTHRNKNKKDLAKAPILSYTPPKTFDAVNGSEVQNSFTVPWHSEWGEKYYACVVAVKLKDATAENRLSVNYLDKDGNAIEGVSPVTNQPAVLKGTTEKPTWLSFLNQDQSADKVSAKPEYRGEGAVLVPKNAEQEKVSVALTLNKPGYASAHFKAEITGDSNNVLNLYFYRVSDVTYEWTGLPDDAVLSKNNPAVKPLGNTGVAEGVKFNVDSKYSNGTLAYEMNGDKVVSVYRFSGWSINGESRNPGDEIALAGENVVLRGVWEPLSYSAAIHAAGKPYDGEPLPDGLVITTKKPFPGEAPTYYFKKKGEEGLGSTDRPTNAAEYVVTAVWPATDKHPEVTATDEFTIAPREVELKSADDSKTFDGTPLTKHEYAVTKGSFVKNDVESLKVAYTGTQTDPGSSENFFTAVFESEPLKTNYKITTSNGQLAVTRATDAIATIVLTGASNEKTYDGVTEFEAIGLASITSETPGFNAGNANAHQFTFNNAVYTIEGISTSDPKSKDAVAKMSNNVTGDFVVKSANGVVVTDQFAIVPAPGELTVRPMAVTLASKSASKIYDGTALTAGLENEDSIPQALKSEADINTTGVLTDVKRANNDPAGAIEGIDNGIEVVGKAANERAEGVNEYKAINYSFTIEEGALTVYPKALPPVDPDDPKPDYPYPIPPVDPDDPNGPKDDPYKDMKVGALDDKDYNGKSWESVQNPEVTSGQNTLAKGTDYVQASTADTTNAGPVAVTITGQGNYCGTVEVPYRIKPVAVTVKVDDQTKKFGDSDRAFTYTVTGTVNGETISGIATSRTNPTEEVGTYEGILTASVPSQRNYNVTVENGKFIIIPPDAADIIARSVVTTYDGQDHSIVVEPVNGWTIEYAESQDGPWATTNPGYQDAGTYTVYVRITRPGTDSVGPISRTVTINPAPVTITVNDATKVAGTDDPEFTGTIEGEVAGHELTGVSYFRKGDSEAVGTYIDELTADYDENGNYAVTVIDGDFTITPVAVPAVPPTPPTPGPLDTLITTVTDFLATPVIGPGAAAVEAIADDGNPLAQIEDDGTPMSAFDHPFCWVHYYILLGIIITAIYGGGVIARRLGYNHKVKKYEDDVLGEDKSKGTEKSPVAKEGVQPTI